MFWFFWLIIHFNCITESLVCMMMSSFYKSYKGHKALFNFALKKKKKKKKSDSSKNYLWALLLDVTLPRVNVLVTWFFVMRSYFKIDC